MSSYKMLLIDEVVRGENNYLEDNSALGVLRFPSVVLFLKGWWVNEMVVPVPTAVFLSFVLWTFLNQMETTSPGLCV